MTIDPQVLIIAAFIISSPVLRILASRLPLKEGNPFGAIPTRSGSKAPAYTYIPILGSAFAALNGVVPRWHFFLDLIHAASTFYLWQALPLALFIKTWVFFTVSWVLVVTDLLDHYVPNRLVYPLLVSAPVFAVLLHKNWSVYLTESLLAMAYVFIGYMIFAFVGSWIYKKQVIGGGDIKYAVAMAGYWGLSLTLMGLYIAYLLGTIVGIGFLIAGKKKRGDLIPFIPYLVVGIWIALIYEDPIYLFLIGIFN